MKTTCYGCIIFSRDLPSDDARLQKRLPIIEVGFGSMVGWDYAPEYSLCPYPDQLILVCPECIKRLNKKERAKEFVLENVNPGNYPSLVEWARQHGHS